MTVKVVSLVRGVRKLRGSSQPLLALADNDGFYVVKFEGNVPGQHALFNEAAGTILYRTIGLPVPDWQPVYVTQSFFERNSVADHETPTGSWRPRSGFAFASRLVIGHQGSCHDLLPSRSIARLRQSEMFWLAWLVDVCALHSDNRQAVFTVAADGKIDTIFIDHGRMFGGLTGFDEPKMIASRYLDARFYPEFTSNTFETIKRLLLEFNPDECLKQVTAVPDTWVTSQALCNLRATLSHLTERNVWENMLHTIVSSLVERRPRNEHESIQSGPNPNCGVLYS